MKNKNKAMVPMAGFLLFALSVMPVQAAEKMTVKTGYLTCHEAAGWGFIIGSSHSIHCTYTSNKHRTEYYTGTISKFGADIGYLPSPVHRGAGRPPSTDRGRGAVAGA